MVEVGYWEAWSLWWSGVKLEDFAMWGLPFLWWARIGKLLQFAGGAVVVLDLVGTDRLLRWSHTVQRFSKTVIAATKAWWKFSIPVRFAKFSSASIPFVVLWVAAFFVTGTAVARRVLPEIDTAAKVAVATMLLAGLVAASLLTAIGGIASIVCFSVVVVPANHANFRREYVKLENTVVYSRMRTYVPLRRRQVNRSFTAISAVWLTFGLISLLVMTSIGGIVPEAAPWNIPKWIAAWLSAMAVIWGISQVLSAPFVGFFYAIRLILFGLAHVFHYDSPRHPARWVAFFLVVIGFHFDLLGS
ncbi:hypothetical protein [Saccharopolyspora gloriosae]|uniref:hypothetical protein n=1 Tax=Saccharopolyspora gloriosae TaxID=455344 RepID=UPI001FB70964|nr:hypothetical protein [Saccharopolyspora gloriosae]